MLELMIIYPSSFATFTLFTLRGEGFSCRLSKNNTRLVGAEEISVTPQFLLI